MWNKSRAITMIAFTFLSLFLGACGRGPVTPTAPEAIYTEAARTFIAQLTQAAGETAVVRLTELAQRPTDTPAPPTAIPVPTETPPATATLTPTQPPATPTATRQQAQIPCDWAQFVGDVGIQDGAVLSPDVSFTKIWRVRNIGSCTWTPDYALVFVGGDRMDAPTVTYLPYAVRPGEMVELSVQMTSPNILGAYQGNWLLSNARGDYFGVDAEAQGVLSVLIEVARRAAVSDYDFDFAAEYCRADWRSETGSLDCPGSNLDPDGSVILVGNPYLESRREDELAIWTRPNNASRGRVYGEFPSYRVNSGDHFLTEIGCLRESTGCDVIFRLDYSDRSGVVRNLGSWREAYDEKTTVIDLDLSDLAGSTVQFILGVENRGDPAEADGLWLVPHISNLGQQFNLVLTWQRRGGSNNACDELNIYLSGAQSAEARAITCKNGRRELGNYQLNAQEVSQVLDWVSVLMDFDAEVFTATTEEPVTAFIKFNGNGAAVASNADIQSMQSLADRLFAKISP